MMANMKFYEMKKRINNLLKIESVTANKTLRLSQKNKDKDVETVAQAYLLGLERIQSLINNMFKEIKIEK